jgi:hypothetical protein
MKVLALLCSFAASGLAGPAPSQWQIKRAATPAYTSHTIDQPVCNLAQTKSHVIVNDSQIDHFPKSDRYEPHTADTFKQRYVFDSSYYKPGGPVFLYIGGETSVESRFSNLQTGSECPI